MPATSHVSHQAETTGSPGIDDGTTLVERLRAKQNHDSKLPSKFDAYKPAILDASRNEGSNAPKDY